MSTLTYVNNLTFLQGCTMVLVIFFTFFEIRRWKTLEGINKNFIKWFIARSVIMILVFMSITLLAAMLISFFTMVCVGGFGGSFYSPRPKDPSTTDWVKYKSLGIDIPRDVLKQVFYWVLIDVFAYCFWVIFIPMCLSLFISDKILFERFF